MEVRYGFGTPMFNLLLFWKCSNFDVAICNVIGPALYVKQLALKAKKSVKILLKKTIGAVF